MQIRRVTNFIYRLYYLWEIRFLLYYACTYNWLFDMGTKNSSLLVVKIVKGKFYMQKNGATFLVLKLMNIPSKLIEQLPLTHFQISNQVRLMILQLNFDSFRLKSNAHNGDQNDAQPKVLNLVFDEQMGNETNARSITEIADTGVAHIGRGEFASFEAFSSLIADLGYEDLKLSNDFWLPARSVLTFREIEVLHHVYNGMSSKQIADELNLSARTVELHRQNCSKKIGVITPRALTRLFSSKVLETYMWSMAN